MNIILLFNNDFISGLQRVCLRDRRFSHIQEVHHAAIGDELCVGLLGGNRGTGRVVALTDTSVEMELLLDSPPPEALQVTLVLALPRPKVLKRVLLSAASMGVKHIVLLNAFRVEKSFWKSPSLTEESLREALFAGLEQARDTILPEVLLRPLFKPFVEDELPAIVQGTLPLVAHPPASGPCPRNVAAPVTLAIGPEGGFIPYEVEKLMACGFTPISLGERILRVETAVPALLSRLF
jgi:RsmE family RNA methyltransferase